ncbi:MAG: right-handed parallel beta-helix repeat-containing protein [Planctomycetes bacterium]|nr:right-handed parallel beta-helix repeat-containing protein [Planctomycetota bacterium]
MGAEVYVSANGRDDGNGTKKSPFGSLDRALQAFRSAEWEEARIVVEGGRYYEVSLELTPDDAGLMIEGDDGTRPVLYGGRRIDDWEDDGDGLYRANLPGVKQGDWDFRGLVVNGRLATRARLPEENRFWHESEFDGHWMSTTAGGWDRDPTDEELTTLRYKTDDIGEWFEPENAEITVYHQWDESLVGVDAIDMEAQIIRFSSPCGHPPGAFGNPETGAGKTYVIWNVRKGMTRPGQWYLDRRRGCVVYWPRRDEDIHELDIVAPVTQSVIRFAGTEEEPVVGVELRNLTISAASTPLQAGGFAANKLPGALSGEKTEECRIEGVHVRSVAGHGIALAASRKTEVENCDVVGTGAGGIYLRGRGSGITDCLVDDVGRMYPSGIGVRGTGGMRIRHNEIRRTPYSGLNVSGGEGAVIENNLFEKNMTELHDGAAIYVTFCEGYVIRNNVARDITHETAHAYYLDEQSERCLVEGNLAVNCYWPSHNHMARRNIIRNNVFVHDGDMQLTFPKCEEFAVEENILDAGGSIVIKQFDAISSMPNNVIHSGAGEVQVGSGRGYEGGELKPYEPSQGTILADPMFVDREGGDYRLRTESPAVSRGIEPRSWEDAGRTAERD